MKRKHLLFALILSFLGSAAIAQKGTISGRVTSGDNAEAVPFANVKVLELTTGGAADFDGNYSFTLDAGNYTVVTSSIGLRSDTTKVAVKSGEVSTVNVTLKSDAIIIGDGFTVVAKANKQNEDVQLLERKGAKKLTINIGAEKLAKTGANNVVDGLGKTAGLSVVGSRHVFVRGMGDRYNSAYINGMPIASLDPDKKVIPLDIFPTAIVSSLSVSKAFSADAYGDFSGGAIDIRTKDYPDEPTLNVKLGAGFNSQATFKDFRTYNGGGTDYFGLDDGTRDLPAEVAATDNYNSEGDDQYQFEQNFNSRFVTAPVNTNWSILGGNYLKGKKEGAGLGFLVSASHNSSRNFQAGSYRIINADDDIQIDYDRENYTRRTSSSAMVNLNLDLNKNHSLSFNSILANQSRDDVRQSQGFHFDYENEILARRTTYQKYRILINQLSGEHKLGDLGRLRLNWAASMNNARSKEPDRKQLVYLVQEDQIQFNDQDLNDNHRFFSELEEDEISAKVEGTYALYYDELDEKDLWSVTAGYNLKAKERFFDFRQFNFLLTEVNGAFPAGVDPENPDEVLSPEQFNGAFSIEEQINPASDYTATLDIHAGYLTSALWVNKKLQLLGGVRLELGEQIISFRNQATPILTEEEVLDGLEVLPTLSSIYNISEKQQFRASASKTISRPSFREVAPFVFIEDFGALQTQGEPTLTNGDNYNLDLRYEIYPNRGELIAVTGFGKFLNDPIERVRLATSSGQLQSFQNADQAVVAGFELEYTKKLRNIVGDSSFLKDFIFNINASYIYSQVSLAEDGGNIQTNNQRALQGASPYLINADLSYERWWNDKVKSTITLSYNVFGKRIYSVGFQGIGDTFEKPVNTVNLIVKTEVGDHWVFGASGRNLLNPDVVREQESSTGEGLVVNTFKRGVRVGVSVGYKFL